MKVVTKASIIIFFNIFANILFLGALGTAIYFIMTYSNGVSFFENDYLLFYIMYTYLLLRYLCKNKKKNQQQPSASNRNNSYYFYM